MTVLFGLADSSDEGADLEEPLPIHSESEVREISV